MPGAFELIIILTIVVILFGVGKLPKVLGQMGKGVKAFKEGVQGNPLEDDEDDVALDVTPPEPPKAIDEKPTPAVEEAEEVVSEVVEEAAEEADKQA